jgi:hypothetical protein
MQDIQNYMSAINGLLDTSFFTVYMATKYSKCFVF